MATEPRIATDRLAVLLLEDSPLDADLIATTLEKGEVQADIRRVETRTGFVEALRGPAPDLILADYSLPDFDGLSALEIVQEQCPDVPFIFVSGTMGEETAIDTLKRGATDYVLKMRKERLVPAVRRALSVTRDRAERRRAEAALRESESKYRQLAEQLAESDRRKDEFLAMLAHELRNPLAPIRNCLQVLRLAGTDPVMNRQACEMMERQVAHLVRLVDDLLDLSRIQRGTIRLVQEPTDLAAVVAHAVDTSRPLISARQHALEVRDGLPVRVNGDPVRLAQVVSNLLNNAAKYTPDGGRITLTVGREGDEAVVRVRDTGDGIAPELLPLVFDLFVQAERSLARSEGGLGIGLTLVRNLVELHGGSVEAHSDGPDRGSEFVVRLPALPDADPVVSRDADRSAPPHPRPRSCSTAQHP